MKFRERRRFESRTRVRSGLHSGPQKLGRSWGSVGLCDGTLAVSCSWLFWPAVLDCRWTLGLEPPASR
ncbi:hypothetical protein HTSR_1260 [Halodesulfurarchaeum formicicum]|uniref:Uncharacterized protein n=1 Tax=Halodesulfurarchaeum formicicum TaxID=1873524 RepID=A0A1D8S510_9EURY|nr:hypothetical protein HTSR_1260 [Halodesulfurarchaeum formicicum]APE95776.1 hypothetical protein HSR6_1333 [Halodesulfurarchaeum formicicum]